MEPSLFEILAPYLDAHLTLDVPGLGVTNVNGQIEARQNRAILDYAATDFVRTWRSNWEVGRQARVLRLQQLQQQLSESSEDSVKQMESAEKYDGLTLPLVKQSLWVVMAQYERATIQEFDRVYREAERREQIGTNSYSYSRSTNSIRRRTSRGTPGTTNGFEQLTQARAAIRSIFAQKAAVPAYQAALVVFQNSQTAVSIKAAAQRSVTQGLAREIQAMGKDNLTLLRGEVFAPGLDGRRVLIMQWSARKI